MYDRTSERAKKRSPRAIYRTHVQAYEAALRFWFPAKTPRFGD